MENESEISLHLVDDYVRLLAEKLQTVLKDSRSPGKVHYGAQKTPQGILGYISFLPHQNPEEETVDAIILIKLIKDPPQVSADICWSDGEIIDEFGKYEMSSFSLESFSQTLQFAFSHFEEKAFEKMAELITSNLQPKYRNN